MKLMISIIGAGTWGKEPIVSPEELAQAEEVGRLLAQRGAVTVSGGGSGVMEAVSKGAKEAGGLTVGIIPGFEKKSANRYVDIAATTGMALMRNFLTVRCGDAVIMVSGGGGTLNELTAAVMEHTVPVVVLEGSGGWADRIREMAYEGKYLDQRRRIAINFASSPQEAVDLAIKLGMARNPAVEGVKA